MERFEIVKNITIMVKRFNLREHKLEFKIKSVPNEKEPITWIKGAVEDILEYEITKLNPEDKVGITFCGKSFEERGPGWTNFKNASEIKVSDVWEIISKIFQSNSEGISTDTFCLGITSIQFPHGQGNNRANKYNTFNEECSILHGIVTVNNTDNLCLPRALVIAIAFIKKDSNYSKIRKDTGKLQTQKAAEMVNYSGVNILIEGCGISELCQFQDFLKDYKIVVYKYGSKGRDLVFEGNGVGEKRINLLCYENHYNVITSLTAAFCCGYFCETCYIPFNKKNDHRCGGTSPQCQNSPRCPKDLTNILCAECNQKFRGQQCFDNHKVSGSFGIKSICDEVRKCTDILLQIDNVKLIDKNNEFIVSVMLKYLLMILYYDTDSVIYIEREEKYNPQIGDFIGDMTDEIKSYGIGSYITEFVSGGPKNYAYKFWNTKDNTEKIVCKVKGICHNYSSCKKVNFDTIKAAVLNPESNDDIEILSQNIRRNRHHDVITVPEVKLYRPDLYQKNVDLLIISNHSSFPYDYKRFCR